MHTAFQKTHIQPAQNLTETILIGFQILAEVTIPKGVVMMADDTPIYAMAE